jgi:glycosyltransferase involved in cell wall biosynthesis
MTEQPELTVIIPAFNEAENLQIIIPPLITYCASNNWSIILVNDGSTDGTAALLEDMKVSDQIIVITHKLNRGYGAAIKSGISACKTAYCATMDADGQHRLEDIGKLYNCLKSNDADLVIGSRKGLRSGSLARRVGKYIIRMTAKMLMNIPVYDINSGMKIYRTELAHKYFRLAPDTMSYSDIITLIFINNRHLVLEEPITILSRLKGDSTIGIQTAFQTVMEIINIVILFNPLRIFLTISLTCIILTLAWGVRFIAMGHGVTTGTVLGLISGLMFFLLGLIAEQLSLIRRKQN